MAATVTAVALLIAFRQFGAMTVLTVLALITLGVWPKVLYEFGNSAVVGPYVGIGGASATIHSYSIVLVASLLLMAARWGFRLQLLLWAPVALWITLGVSTTWPPTPMLTAGISQLLTGAMAWGVGVYAGRIAQISDRLRHRILTALLILVLLQLAVVAFQWLGLDVNPMSAANQAQLPGRFNGTLAHPNDLGKVTVLLTLIALPLSSTPEGIRPSRSLFVLLVAALATLLATGGRAVTIAAGAMILLWVLLQPGTRIGRSRKAVAVVLSGVFVGVAALALWGRFEEDPAGGARSGLTQLALNQISLRPVWGVGPNMYVEAVGRYDPLTASGVPVHNAFLLAAAELGIVGAALLALPFAAVVAAAVKHVRSRDVRGSWARPVIAALPAVLLIGLTGWGLLGSYVFPLFAFTFGWALGGLTKPATAALTGMSAREVAINGR